MKNINSTFMIVGTCLVERIMVVMVMVMVIITRTRDILYCFLQ